jgi:Xaa-Pro aminopeptidase
MDRAEPPLYPRFSEAEHERRNRLVRALAGSEGLDGLVIFGWSAMNRAAQADVYYIAGYLGMRDNYVLFPLNGDPVFFVQSYNHVPNASVVSVLDDVRWGGVSNGETIGEELKRRGLRRIGVVGWMPYQHYAAMAAAAPGVEFKDVTPAYRRIRLTKSAEELTWLQRGAAFTDAALQGLAEGLVPGVREFQLAEAIETSYLKEGGMTTVCYLASTPMSNPSRCVPAQVFSSRVIEVGDVVSCEMSVAYSGYAGQGLRTYTVAAEPTPVIAELHAVAEEVFHKVAAVMRAGATMRDVWDASDMIAERGFTIRDGLAHGFGIGLLPPAVRTRDTTHGLDDDWVFEENQTLVIQPNIITLDERVGVQIGDLCVVTPAGARSLHKFPFQLIRAG